MIVATRQRFTHSSATESWQTRHKMRSVGIFLAGVATGWVLRSSFDSFRDLTVRSVAAAYDMAERARRFAATEREYLEDLLAEGKARHEAHKARRAEQKRPAVVKP